MDEKNKYISKYSNGKSVSAAQYITEIVCENKAKLDKCDLHYRFWVSKKWSLYYRNQIATAHKLLQKYNSQAIISALKDKRAERIYSLRAPHLHPIIEEHQTRISSENTNLTIEIDRSKQKTHRKDIIKKSVISKLKELE